MAIENLTPENRVERLLSGADLEPANRLEYFLKQAGSGGGGGGSVYSPVLAQTTKSVSNQWVSSFYGGPILEGASYRVIVNGTTYEPLTGTAGEEGYICLGDTYVADSDPAGDYPFGIFYKNNQLSAWLETGDSMTMQIDQIIQAVPVPTPAAADTGKVLTANNGAVEWAGGGLPVVFVDYTDDGTTYTSSKTWGELFAMMQTAIVVFRHIDPNEFINCYYISTLFYDEDGYCIVINEGANQMTWVSAASDGYPSYTYD